MPSVSVAVLFEVLQATQLLSASQAEEVKGSLQARQPDSRAVTEELVRREWLTRYQAEQLLLGQGLDLCFGSYVVQERLGGGGMGQVFKARHRLMDRLVALKTILPDRLQDPQAKSRFLREVRAASKLSHPNIVTMFHADERNGTLYFTMELVPGTDLAHKLDADGPLPLADVVDFVRQAALGLQHAHEQGLVHRDVKPSNLLLTADSRCVKVADLGLALSLTAGTTTGTGSAMLGTIDYMAPEQVMNPHGVDIRADIYSLGCSFYHLVTGRPPFADVHPLARPSFHLTHEPPAPERFRPELPEAFRAVLRRMMAKRPEDRPATPAEAADTLAQLLRTASPSEPAPVRTAFPVTLEQRSREVYLAIPGYWSARSPDTSRTTWEEPTPTPAAVQVVPGKVYQWKLDRTVGDTHLAGLAPLGEVAASYRLDLRGTRVTDAGLTAIGAVSGLRELDLGLTTVTGTGLEKLQALVALTSLGLGRASVTDAGLASLSGLGRLESLDLGWCKGFTDAGLVHVRGLSALRELSLSETGVTDAGLALLAGLNRLRTLQAAWCRGLTDAGIVHLVGMTRLEELDLSNTAVSDLGAARLGELTSLRELDLGGTRVTDGVLTALGRLPNLAALYLGNTRITDAGLAELSRFPRLERLQLWKCKGVSEASILALERESPNCCISR